MNNDRIRCTKNRSLYRGVLCSDVYLTKLNKEDVLISGLRLEDGFVRGGGGGGSLITGFTVCILVTSLPC